MLVLHPFSRFRINEQLETWRALEEIREHFRVVDVFLKEAMDYDDVLLRFYGVDDLIVVEQDIVPSVEQIRSLTLCPESWCCCEYTVRYMGDKNPAYNVQTGFGLTKFSLKAQELSPSSVWHGKGEYFNLDCRVTAPLIQAGLSPHVHGEVKHTRIVDWTGETK